MDDQGIFWHARYQQQADWTAATRRFIFDTLGVSNNDPVLEVGCGSGAVLSSLKTDGFTDLHGIDIDLDILKAGQEPFPFACADGLNLPFPYATFAQCLCHFFLMWVSDAERALDEMARVTKPGGYVLALAEPDHQARLSYPDSLVRFGDLQTTSLELQGADTRMGRQLMSLFVKAGLTDVGVGIIPGKSGPLTHADFFRQDREVLARDLAGLIEQEELEGLLARADHDIQHGAVMWFVPVFYAYGRVSGER